MLRYEDMAKTPAISGINLYAMCNAIEPPIEKPPWNIHQGEYIMEIFNTSRDIEIKT